MKIWSGHQKGVNLGGWYSQCDHSRERYDKFITEEDFAVIRSWGADHVRVPIDYELLEDVDGAPLEEGYLRLEKTIGWCRDNGLNMILDLHKTAGYSFDADEGEAGFFDSEFYQERFYRLWERIAGRFGQNADMLAFELLNEVTEKSYAAAWNRIAGECIRRIRRIAPDAYILVGGYWYNSAAAVRDLDPPADERIVYNFHCYEPHIFTHQGAYWMPTMDQSFRIPVTATYGQMEAVSQKMVPGNVAGLDKYPPEETLSAAYFEAYMADAASAAAERGALLYCGEYGVIDLADPEDAYVWYRMIHQAFDKYGIGRAAWSYREMDFGLSDKWMDPVRERLLEVL